MRKLALLCLVTIAGSAPAVLVLDDFTTGEYDSGLLQSGSVLAWTPASVPGGIRATFIRVEQNEDGFDARLRVKTQHGVFSASSDPSVEAFTQLAYGVATNDNLLGSLPLNLDLSGQGRLELTFQSNDLPLNVQSFIIAGNAVYSVSQLVAGGVPTGTKVAFDYGFVGAGLSDVDGILFNFDMQSGGDYALTGVTAVPEPATVLALGLGLAALARRRRA